MPPDVNEYFFGIGMERLFDCVALADNRVGVQAAIEGFKELDKILNAHTG